MLKRSSLVDCLKTERSVWFQSVNRASEIRTVWEWDNFGKRRNTNVWISDAYCIAHNWYLTMIILTGAQSISSTQAITLAEIIIESPLSMSWKNKNGFDSDSNFKIKIEQLLFWKEWWLRWQGRRPKTESSRVHFPAKTRKMVKYFGLFSVGCFGVYEIFL